MMKNVVNNPTMNTIMMAIKIRIDNINFLLLLSKYDDGKIWAIFFFVLPLRRISCDQFRENENNGKCVRWVIQDSTNEKPSFT